MKVSQLLVEAAASDQELLSLLEQWRASEDEGQKNEIHGQVASLLMDDYERLMIQHIAPIVKNYNLGEGQEGQNPVAANIEYFFPMVLMKLTDYFLRKYDPSLSKISTFVGNSARELAKNEIRSETRNRRQFQTLPHGKEGDVYEGTESAVDPLANVTAPISGKPREVDPLYSTVLQDYSQQLQQLLNEDEMDLLEQYFGQGKTLQELGNERGVTRERIRQIISGLTEKLSTLLHGKVELAKKSILLSLPQDE